MAHQSKAPPPLSEKRPDIPAGLAAIVAKMMAKRQGDRFQSAQEVAAALQNWLAGGTAASAGVPAAGNGRIAAEARKGPQSPRAGSGVAPANSGPARPAPSAKPPSGSGVKESGPRRNPAPVSAPPAPAEPADSEFASFELLNTAPPLHGSARSSVVRSRRRRNSGVPGVVWGAIVVAVVIVVLFVVVLIIARSSADKDSSLGPGADFENENISLSSDQADEARFGPDLIGQEIVVGPKGQFQTIGAAIDTVNELFPSGRQEPQVIKVTGGRHYEEAIEIDDHDFKFKAWIRLVSTGSSPAILDPPGTGPAIQLTSVKHVEIDGFQIDGQGRDVVIDLRNYMIGLTLRDLTITSLSGTGIRGRSLAGASERNERLVIENITFKNPRPGSVAVKLTEGQGRNTAYITMRGLRVLGPVAAGVVFSDAPVEVEISESIFSGAERGIHFKGARRWRGVSIANNTFHENDVAILFDTMPEPNSDGFLIRRNVFVDSSRADAVVEERFDPDAFQQMLTSRGTPLAHNMTTRSDFPAEAIDLFQKASVTDADFDFASLEPDQESFLAPSKAGPAAQPKGQGLMGYAGAVPPS